MFLIPLKTYSQEKVRNVVIIFSYSSTLPAYENILTGIKSTIRENIDEPVNIISEYLDIGRSDNDDYARLIINMYNSKLKEFNIDLLITVGPGINDLLLKYGSSELKALKTVNCDADIPGRITLRDLKIRYGIELLTNFKVVNTLKEAFALFPDYKDVFVISGVSSLDSYFGSLLRQTENEFEPLHHFKFISGLTMDSTISFVRTIPANSIVVVPGFLLDAAKIPFSTPEVLDIISRNSRAPVFPITDAAVNKKGGIGGYLFSYNSFGKEAGRISREILNGKQINDIILNRNNFYEHIYDWNELKRWHLTDSKAIPSNSIFYNRDDSFFELYKWYILGVFLFILSQTFLILYLFRLNKRQKEINLKMEETESMYRELIRTDRLSKMSTLTASLSHELFQPLAAIRYTAEAGKLFIDSDKLEMSKAYQMFENILEDDIRATKIITSVKSLMKTDSQEKENVDLNALISETATLISTDVKKDKIKIKVACDADKIIVFGNKIQLQQVLMNFIRNAAAAMEKNDPENKILGITLKVIKDEAIVSVRDSGPGIDASVREKLFKPFVSTKKDGFGIGLTLCKSLIESHNGKIWAEDLPEGGTMFSFSLKMVRN